MNIPLMNTLSSIMNISEWPKLVVYRCFGTNYQLHGELHSGVMRLGMQTLSTPCTLSEILPSSSVMKSCTNRLKPLQEPSTSTS